MDFFPQIGVLRFFALISCFAHCPCPVLQTPLQLFSQDLSLEEDYLTGGKKTEEETITQLRKQGGGNII